MINLLASLLFSVNAQVSDAGSVEGVLNGVGVSFPRAGLTISVIGPDGEVTVTPPVTRGGELVDDLANPSLVGAEPFQITQAGYVIHRICPAESGDLPLCKFSGIGLPLTASALIFWSPRPGYLPPSSVTDRLIPIPGSLRQISPGLLVETLGDKESNVHYCQNEFPLKFCEIRFRLNAKIFLRLHYALRRDDPVLQGSILPAALSTIPHLISITSAP